MRTVSQQTQLLLTLKVKILKSLWLHENIRQVSLKITSCLINEKQIEEIIIIGLGTLSRQASRNRLIREEEQAIADLEDSRGNIDEWKSNRPSKGKESGKKFREEDLQSHSATNLYLLALRVQPTVMWCEIKSWSVNRDFILKCDHFQKRAGCSLAVLPCQYSLALTVYYRVQTVRSFHARNQAIIYTLKQP